MPRTRSLKPEFFTDPDLGELSPLHRILFEGLWCHADREGRLEDKPKDLKVRILPFDACNVDQLLADLERAARIRRYFAEGKRVIWVIRFTEHQHPHRDEKPSQLPPPPAEVQEHGDSRASTDVRPTEHGDFGANTPGSCLLVSGSSPPPPEQVPDPAAPAARPPPGGGGDQPPGAGDPPLTPDGYWEFVQGERERAGLPLETQRPKGWTDWHRRVSAKFSPSQMADACARYLRDQHFRDRNWPTSVFIAERVFEPRAADPPPRPRRL